MHRGKLDSAMILIVLRSKDLEFMILVQMVGLNFHLLVGLI